MSPVGSGKGRPRQSDLLDEVGKDLLKHIRAGVPFKYACEAVGISYQTYAEWVRKGKRARSGQYRDFYEEVKKARGNAISRNVAIIQKAAEKTWQAAAWWLERTCPEEFGRVNRPDSATGPGNHNVRIMIENPGDAGPKKAMKKAGEGKALANEMPEETEGDDAA